MNFLSIIELRSHLLQAFPHAEAPGDWEIVPEICPQGMDGDITVNCFRLGKPLRQSPDKIADAAEAFLQGHVDVLKAEKIKAFVNVTLKPEAVHRDSTANIPRLLKSATVGSHHQKRILIEYSAPNTNKPQHLGHVRNNTLGMALVSLLKRVGHDVIPVNLVNDRGVHICKSMIAYQRFGEGVTPESTGIKGDHLVGDFYVKYNNALQEQLKQLRDEKPELTDQSDDDLFLETELGAATQKMLQDWEAGVPEVRKLWQMMNEWVFAGFDQTYKRMGVTFDHTYLESNTYLLGKDCVEEGLVRGIFDKRDDGAVQIDLGKMGKKILLRSDGTSVYITQDLGTTLKKYEDHHPDSQIWIVGDEQILHFKMLFQTLKKMGYQWADELHHLSYGMVNLPSGKMKSREGTVVDADDLFDEMVSLAKEATLERYGDTPPADLDYRSEIIGMGALKFMLLKFNPKTTIMFDPEASVKFEGDTGPYVQYACARINSIERKSQELDVMFDLEDIDWSLLNTDHEKALSIQAFFYPSQLLSCAEKRDCSGLVDYLLSLAKAFSRFYRECQVLNAETHDLKVARLALCYAVRDILTDGIKTLTMRIPEAM